MAAEELINLKPDLKEQFSAYKENVDPLGAKELCYYAFVGKEEDEVLFHAISMKNVDQVAEASGIADLSAKRLSKQLNH